jgi:hypothetical protein
LRAAKKLLKEKGLSPARKYWLNAGFRSFKAAIPEFECYENSCYPIYRDLRPAALAKRKAVTIID